MIKREIEAGDIECERRNKKNKGKKQKWECPPRYRTRTVGKAP